MPMFLLVIRESGDGAEKTKFFLVKASRFEMASDALKAMISQS